jgi:intracellular sulfur oxidation DsrE/DsrF family protein
MRSFTAVFGFFLFMNVLGQAQTTVKMDSSKIWTDSVVKSLTEKMSKKIKDSVENSVKDSIQWETLKATGIYPLIKNSEWSAIFPVKNIQEKPDVAMRYKLLINMTQWSKDTSAIRQINGGLAEVGRIINLHIAAGIPKENLDIAMVVHGGALNVYLTNEAYRKKFNVDNPNLDILKQFTSIKTRLLACGQAELFFNIPAADMIPDVKTALTAKVVLSTYQLKGYVLYNVNNDDK